MTKIIEKETRKVICAAAQNKMLEHNSILFQTLRITLLILLLLFIQLFQTCLTLEYYLQKFKKTKTIVL